MLSSKALKEFIEIWEQEIGEKISNEKATEEALNLLTFFDAIYRPVKKEWLKEYDNENNLQNKRDDVNLG